MSIQATAPVDLQDHALVRDWFRELSDHVQAVDFAAARHLFADDFIAFGTYSNFVPGRDNAEANQWRKVWPTIDGFTWRLDDVQALVSPDRLFAVGMAVWIPPATCRMARPSTARAAPPAPSRGRRWASPGSRHIRICRCSGARLMSRTATSRRAARAYPR
ncbi:hypothetical protein ACFQU7_23050 [Pseudoroseomonas wenyumeiae]